MGKRHTFFDGQWKEVGNNSRENVRANDRKTKIYCEMEEGSTVGNNGKMSIYRETNVYDN